LPVVTSVLFVILGFMLVIVVLLAVMASTIRKEEGRLTRIVQQLVCMGFSGLYGLTALRERGLPTVSDDILAERFRRLDDRRRLLRALVERSGWSWALVRGAGVP